MSRFTKARHIFPRHVKIKLVLLLVGIIVGAQIETLTLSLIQPFIWVLTDPDIIYSNQLINFVYRLFRFSGFTPFLAFLAIIISVIYALRGLYFYFFNRIQNRFIARNTVAFSNMALSRTLRQSYLYHVNHNIVQLQRIVTRNVERLFNLVSSIMSLLVDGFMSLFILIFLLMSSLSMTMVVLFFASICIFVYFKLYKNKIKSSGEEEEKGQVQINKSVIQALSGIKEIKIMCREDYFTKKFESVSYNTVKTRERVQSLRQLPKLFIESLCFSGAFIVVAGTILGGIDLQALIPQLGLFVLAGFKLLPAISRLVANITMILRLLPSIDQIYEALFKLDSKYSQVQPEPSNTIVSQDIIVSNVTFNYPEIRKPVLEDISLVIPRNKSVAFVGTSGAGKTTLVDIILGILAPQQGSVVCNGKSVHHHFDDWAKNIGYIPQVIYLLDETIMENVAFGVEKSRIDEAKVWSALEKAQLKEFIHSLPMGLQTTVGDRGVRLSGGQRQRIGIARALYNDPSILVLDEATSSLDNETESAVMDAINSLKGHKTMIIVAHRTSTIEHCDIVYRVKKKKITRISG